MTKELVKRKSVPVLS